MGELKENKNKISSLATCHSTERTLPVGWKVKYLRSKPRAQGKKCSNPAHAPSLSSADYQARAGSGERVALLGLLGKTREGQGSPTHIRGGSRGPLAARTQRQIFTEVWVSSPGSGLDSFP